MIPCRFLKKVLIVVTVLTVAAAVLIPAWAADDQALKIVTIWDALPSTESAGELDFSTALSAVQKERRGFVRGMQDAPGNVVVDEIMLEEDSNEIIRELSDVINNDEPLMVVGASGDLTTMYCSMEVEFFEVPMLIPYADGDIILESTQGFSIRMTPTSGKYAQFIGSSLLPSQSMNWFNTILFDNQAIPDYSIRIGVIFANDYIGHDYATQITQKLMDNGMEIENYIPYEQGTLYRTVAANWNAQDSSLASLDIVVLIGFDQDPFTELQAAIGLWNDVDEPPLFLLVGYVPNGDNEWMAEYANVLSIRQKLDMSSCPADIKSHAEAIGYASGYITKMVLSRAAETQPKERTGIRLWFTSAEQKRKIHQQYIDDYRGNIRSNLIELVYDVPCYGRTDFKSRAEDPTVLELVRYTGPDEAEILNETEVLQFLLNRLRKSLGIVLE